MAMNVEVRKKSGDFLE